MKPTWSTDANELIRLFRECLLSLTPWLDAARIAWKDGEAYDDWDEICAALFKAVVANSVRWAVEGSGGDAAELLDYESFGKGFKERSQIAVQARDLAGHEGLVLFRLATRSRPLDTVVCLVTERNELRQPLEYYEVPYEEADFSVRYRVNGSLRDPVSSLQVNV